MSDILIKGMEMPKSCPCELLGIGYDLYCPFVGGIPARVKEYNECCQNGTRPSWCPIIPVPDHGRLIQDDALDKIEHYHDGTFGLTDYERGWNAALLLCKKRIEAAPTIIPADPAEEGGET